MTRKLFTMIFLIAFALTSTLGCASLQNGIKIPAGCEQSLIYKNVPYADIMSGLITLGGLETYRVLKHKGVDMVPVTAAIEKINVILDNPQLTYPQFVAALGNLNDYIQKYAGLELVFAAGLVDGLLQEHAAMNPCDRQYLDRAVNNMLMTLKLIE